MGVEKEKERNKVCVSSLLDVRRYQALHARWYEGCGRSK
jgi:hypothetical protein